MPNKLLLFVICIPGFILSCGKKIAEPISNSFAISGPSEIKLEPTVSIKGSAQLSVNNISGSSKVVTLTTLNLPAGVYANFSMQSGTTDFSPIVTLTDSTFFESGTYPFKIVGSSFGVITTYDMNLIIPAQNGFWFDSALYSTSSILRDTANGNTLIKVKSLDHTGASCTIGLPIILPLANGNYYFPVNNSGFSSWIECDQRRNVYKLGVAEQATVIFRVKNDKIAIMMAPTTVYEQSGATPPKTLSFGFNEQ